MIVESDIGLAENEIKSFALAARALAVHLLFQIPVLFAEGPCLWSIISAGPNSAAGRQSPSQYIYIYMYRAFGCSRQLPKVFKLRNMGASATSPL